MPGQTISEAIKICFARVPSFCVPYYRFIYGIFLLWKVSIFLFPNDIIIFNTLIATADTENRLFAGHFHWQGSQCVK